MNAQSVLGRTALQLGLELQSGMYDKTHANTLRYDAERNSFLLSCAGINTILEINTSGEIIAAFLGAHIRPEAFTRGTRYNGYPIYTGAVYDKPHGARFDSDGTLWSITDEEVGEGELRKKVVGYRAEGTELELFVEVGPPYEGMLPMAGGEVIPMGAGHLAITWGFAGVVEEVTIEEERLWMLELPFQEGVGFIGSTPSVDLFFSSTD